MESCRTCGNKFSLVPDTDQVKPIIAMDEIAEQLTAWKMQVAREDGLPQYMCTACLAEFQTVLKLKSSCLDTLAKFDYMRSLELYVAPLNKPMHRDRTMQGSMDNLDIYDVHLYHEPKAWKCQICAKQFPSNQEARFKFHMKWHQMRRRFKCPMCRFSCRAKENLKAHKLEVHAFVKCSSCGKKMMKHLLHRHFNKHLKDCKPKKAKKMNLLLQQAAAEATAAVNSIPKAPTVAVATPRRKAAPSPMAPRRWSLRVASATRGSSNGLQPSKDLDRKTELGQHGEQDTMPRI
ncbi:transcriptional repressor CTCFL-like [Drosophila kikkawai]|uniref:Transcriptional repressor CTCFL-like n=1 Tax=Drosophila kikkawai TaxID=30033 RepID=A0ABM3C4A5_DROKI|nr:zinc finger protein 652-like [Drosophila kikkawai]